MYEDSKRDRFWHAFGLKDMSFANGLKILEFGCGEGERCLELANAGAADVVGLDISETSIDTARNNLENEYRHTPKVISYYACDLRELGESDFDVVVSENTFEHLSDLDDVLQELLVRMKPNAVMYIGFAPLYYSPQGDHGWMRQYLPFFRNCLGRGD